MFSTKICPGFVSSGIGVLLLIMPAHPRAARQFAGFGLWGSHG
jgi:UPF0716 family protein affecting phage T7 exclusion